MRALGVENCQLALVLVMAAPNRKRVAKPSYPLRAQADNRDHSHNHKMRVAYLGKF
jgi:hypothetical protein